MHKQRSDIADRAWNILRLALLWARKGGIIKRRLLMNLHFSPKFLKALGGHSTRRRDSLHYGERELSFENTPIIHIKMPRPSSMRFRMPRIPCLTSQVDFDYDFEFNDDDDDDVVSYCNDGGERKSISMGGDYDYEDDDDRSGVCEEMIPGDEGIDHKAEQFIAKFYDQMKLQRQRSYLQYHEMLNRSTG